MIRNAVRAATVVVAALVIPVTMFAAPLPASAAGDTLCETNGNYCVGSDNLNLYTAVTEEAVGRNLILASLNGKCCGGLPTYLLEFSANTNYCVGVTNNTADAAIKPCYGGYGVVWGLQINSNDHDEFANQALYGFGGTQYLAGKNNGVSIHCDPERRIFELNFDWH